MSREGEWFLAGVLDGIADGESFFSLVSSITHRQFSHAHGWSLSILFLLDQIEIKSTPVSAHY